MGEEEPARGGCLALLGFLVLELGVAGAFYGAAHAAAAAVLRTTTAWPAARIDGWAFGAGLLFAFVGLFLIDRWCKKATGTSLVEDIGNLPPWP